MSNILITGGTSTIGQHLKEFLPEVTYVSSKDYDLTSQSQVQQMYQDINPDTVIHLAARVGGIQENIDRPVDFFEQNLLMNTLVLQEAYKANVNNFIGILSTCIYPDKLEESMYPLTEDMLHIGPPTPTNLGYGYSKRMLGVQIDLYRQKYNKNYSYITPCNLYSEYDDFNHDQKAHFITALLKKIKTAVENGDTIVPLFGTGAPLRQFIYARDVAKLIHWSIQRGVYENINIADSSILSIKQLAETTLKALNIQLELKFDWSKPDGQYRKDVSNKKMLQYFPDFKFTSFDKGIKLVYESLCNNSN